MTTLPTLLAPHQFKSNAAAGAYYVVPGNPPVINIQKGMIFLDNYFFFAGSLNTAGNPPNNVIYNTSYSGDPYGVWDTTSYILSQINPQEIQWMEKHHNYLIIFTEAGIEYFYDAGQGLGSPLARQTIFAKNIGILPFQIQNTTAKNGDDIYFIGKNQANYLDVYVLSMYQVRSVGTHYIREVLNYYASGTANSIIGIETIMIDSHTMIMITFGGTNEAVVYFPESQVWWTMTTTDIQPTGTIRTNMAIAAQIGAVSQRPYFVSASQSSGTINFYTSDLESTISNTAHYYTEVFDLGNNYWKHISKVHAIGDYGNNTVTLNYNDDPTYDNFNTCTTINPGTDGYQNSIAWNNVTRFRRGAFRLDFTGIGPSHHRAIDIIYNLGNQ